MAKITHVFSGLTNGLNYYGKIYSMNPNGRVNNRADLKVFSAIPSEFPAVPDSYILIDTYTTSQTFTAPEDGWFKIQLHGASGNGALGYPNRGAWWTNEDEDGNSTYAVNSGASGGGGAYVESIIKMRKNDSVVLVCGAIGGETTATISSSMGDYALMSATSGGNAVNASKYNQYGTIGRGGSSSGGNISNINGSDGGPGVRSNFYDYYGDITIYATPGGQPGHEEGNSGGDGEYCVNGNRLGPSSGKPGFFKISRGNTNLA